MAGPVRQPPPRVRCVRLLLPTGREDASGLRRETALSLCRRRRSLLAARPLARSRRRRRCAAQLPIQKGRSQSLSLM